MGQISVTGDDRNFQDIDRRHLREIGEVPLFAVSSNLRLRAAQEQDRELNDESGFPALVAHLRREIVGRAELIAVRSAVHDLGFVVAQMELAARSELSALLNPEDSARLLAELDRAKARSEEFKSRSSKWNVRLGDGITGASTSVITSEDIAQAPGQTLQDVIATIPGVQIRSLYGGVNGAQSSVDLRGFGADRPGFRQDRLGSSARHVVSPAGSVRVRESAAVHRSCSR